MILIGEGARRLSPVWVSTGSYRIAASASGYVRSTDIITAKNLERLTALTLRWVPFPGGPLLLQ
jgi:hypothetical protein